MHFSYEKIRRPFPVPVRTAQGLFPQRESLLITLSDGENSGKGECAPWPGFGCETLDEAAAFIESCNGFLPEKIPSALPCLGHAVSAALFFCENPWMRDLPPPSVRTKLISRSLESSPDAILETLTRERRNGFSSFKIKIGLTAPEEELRFCEKLLADVPEKVTLRLDANGGFDPTFLPALAALSEFRSLEFVEQPLPATAENDARVFALAEKGGRFALDESVREPWTFPKSSPVVAVVKPLFVSDYPRLLAWLAEKNGPRVVISTSFENSEAGRDALLCAAASVCSKRRLSVGFG